MQEVAAQIDKTDCKGLLNIRRHKLNGKHNDFVLKQVASFNLSPTAIIRMLADPEEAAKHGFPVVTVSHQRISKMISKMSKEDIREQREIYLSDFSNVPLAHKKVRVEELVKQYKALTCVDGQPIKGVIGLRLDILKQIKDEIGEDLEKLMAALREGSRPLNLTLTNNQLIQVGMLLQTDSQVEEITEQRITDGPSDSQLIS